MYLYAEKMICLNPLHNNRKGDNQIILYNAQLKLKLVEEGVLERLSQIWVFLAARVCVSCNWCRIGGDFLCLDNERSSPEIISHFLDLGSNFDRRGGEVRSWQYPDLLKNIQSGCKISWAAQDYPERLNFAKKNTYLKSYLDDNYQNGYLSSCHVLSWKEIWYSSVEWVAQVQHPCYQSTSSSARGLTRSLHCLVKPVQCL